MAAINAANAGSAAAYGGDLLTEELQAAASEVFGTAVAKFPVTTGIAANALALSQMVPSYGAVYCHEAAHIVTDECGAPEFFTGGAKTMGLRAADGEITPQSPNRTAILIESTECMIAAQTSETAEGAAPHARHRKVIAQPYGGTVLQFPVRRATARSLALRSHA